MASAGPYVLSHPKRKSRSIIRDVPEGSIANGSVNAQVALQGYRVTSRGYGMTFSILVVEDEDDVRELVSSSLRNRGFSVLSVPNAEVALQILMEQVKFDLLFTDIVMPG